MGDRYRILRVIARGGTSVVYEAEHTWTGRRVAVKMLLPKLAGGEAQMARFRQEARSAARLSHPHIVDILDMGCDGADGALFLVQALLAGEDLEQRLERTPAITPPELVALLVPILDALRLAHQNGVLHRDIKPSNIFLVASAKGEVVPKLIDFGAVKLVDPGEEVLRLTRTGLAVGTPVYMSPEQLRGEVLDARSDIWSLGVVMYRALSGRLPFETSSFARLVSEARTARAAPIERRDVPPLLTAVMHRALAMNRAERFPSVAAMLHALAPPLSSLVSSVTLQDARERPATILSSPPAQDDQTLVDASLLEKIRSGSYGAGPQAGPDPIFADELTNVPAENERVEDSVDERTPVRVVAEPTPTPAPHAVRRLPVPAVPGRRAGRKPWRGRVRMGVVPAGGSASSGAADGDVLRRLERAIDGSWSLRRFPSYSTLVDALCEEEVELAWLPPVAYLRARRLGPVHLLLALERGGPTSYGSALVASHRSRIQTLADLRGKRVAWVDAWSAAGYLMPRSVLRDSGLDPEQVFASQAFVGSHTAVLDALQQGRAEVGATYCTIDRQGALVAAPWSDRLGIRAVALSAAIPGDAICAAGELSFEDAEAMVEPLVALSAEAEGAAILRQLFGAGHFVEVDASYYHALEDV